MEVLSSRGQEAGCGRHGVCGTKDLWVSEDQMQHRAESTPPTNAFIFKNFLEYALSIIFTLLCGNVWSWVSVDPQTICHLPSTHSGVQSCVSVRAEGQQRIRWKLTHTGALKESRIQVIQDKGSKGLAELL